MNESGTLKPLRVSPPKDARLSRPRMSEPNDAGFRVGPKIVLHFDDSEP